MTDPDATTPPAESSALRLGRWGLSALLGGMAVTHIANAEPFEQLIPDWLPGSPTAWNLAATAAEATSAVLLARRRTARAGGWAALATLSGVYVANIQAAVDGGYEVFDGFAATSTAAWLRLPLQWPLLWLSWRLTRLPDDA